MKGVFRRNGMVVHPDGQSACEALLTVPDGTRFFADINPDARSQRTHNHQFAEIEEYHHHLPEHIAADLPTPEHLRKHALIVAGFCDIEKVVFSSHQDAVGAAMIAKPRSAKGDDYIVVEVSGRVVTRCTPHSQSRQAMGGNDFQASKDAVLEVCARLCGGTLEQLHNSPPTVPDTQHEREAVDG